MQKIELYLKNKLNDALDKLGLPQTDFSFEIPKIVKHGDLSVNIAMQLASESKNNPRVIAQEIVESLSFTKELISKVEIAGPGFINFSFAMPFLQKTVGEIVKQGEKYGRHNFGKNQKAQVEFVSANPTGPLTIGHGRQAVLGDTIANFLEWAGYNVTREYYFNNAGKQMQILGESVLLRYKELLGDQVEFPEDYYQGKYIKDIAQELKSIHHDALRDSDKLYIFQDTAESIIFADIKNTLKRLGINFDIYYNEKDLYDNGAVEEVIDLLKKEDLAYKKDGALWFRTTKFGQEQDRVIVKSTGEPTYRLPDIAYHRTKFERKFDLIVDLFGADHIATYPDVLAGIKALGYDESKVKVLIHQFVTLYQDKEKVKMSTRKANFITLDELVDEVGADVTRWFFLMRSMDSHLNFDLTLAKTQSDENPVYYNQYAHARICSIERNAEKRKLSYKTNMTTLKKLTHPAELDLIKKLIEFSNVVERCAREFTPHQLTQYLSEVSTYFHKFYTECWVLTGDTELSQARLALCLATRIVLANGFKILGISAPDRM
jgi:arginyl-tRNA synthetase